MRRNGLVVRLCGAALLAMAGGTGIASAQVNCEAIPAGPGRTDCYIGLSRINRDKSQIAAGVARQQSDAAPQRDRQAPRNKGASRGARAVGIRGLDDQLASLSGSQMRIPHPRPSGMHAELTDRREPLERRGYPLPTIGQAPVCLLVRICRGWDKSKRQRCHAVGAGARQSRPRSPKPHTNRQKPISMPHS